MNINEASIIPYNLQWRAGIGREKPASSLSSPTDIFNPLTPGSIDFGNIQTYGNPSQERKIKLEKQQALLIEIDTEVTKILINNTEDNFINIKNSIIYKFNDIRKNNSDIIDTEFLKCFYKAAILHYANDWCIKCGKIGVNEFKSTEFITYNKELCINPLLIYSLFTREITGITDVSPIDNVNKLLQTNNNIKGGGNLEGFIEEIDLAYNEIMNQDKPKELLKTELYGRLSSMKHKYIKHINGMHANVINYCNSKPIEMGQFIYDIFYSQNANIYS